MRLQPSCSEIICRLKKEVIHISTDNYPNGAFTSFVSALKGLSKRDIDRIELEFIENNGGGGNWDYIEKVLKIAKQAAKKEMSETFGEKIDEKLWSDEKILDKCNNCGVKSIKEEDYKTWVICENCKKEFCPKCKGDIITIKNEKGTTYFCDMKCRKEFVIDKL